jgi:hypothetical protein
MSALPATCDQLAPVARVIVSIPDVSEMPPDVRTERVSEAERRTCYSREWLRDKVHRGLIRAWRAGPRNLLLDADAVDRVIAETRARIAGA